MRLVAVLFILLMSGCWWQSVSSPDEPTPNLLARALVSQEHSDAQNSVVFEAYTGRRGVQLSWLLEKKTVVIIKRSALSFSDAAKNGQILYRGTKQFFEDASLPIDDGQTYYYSLLLLNEGQFYVAAHIQLNNQQQPPVSAPLPIDELTAISRYNQVFLQWTPPEDPNFKQVAIYRNGELYQRSTQSYFIDHQVEEGEQYLYELFSEDAFATRSLIARGVQLLAVQLLPSQVKNLTIIAEDKKIELFWQAATQAEFKKTIVLLDEQVVYSDKETTVSLEGLNNQQSYHVQIYNEFTDGRPSPVISQRVTIEDTLSPEPVNNVSYSAVDAVVKISWDAITTEDFKEVVVLKDSVEILRAAQFSLTDFQVVNNQQYLYEIVVLDQAGNESQVTAINLLVEPSFTDAFLPEIEVVAFNNQVTLTWPAVDHINFQQTQLYKNKQLVFAGTASEFVDLNVEDGQSYDYQFVHIDTDGAQITQELTVLVEDTIAPEPIDALTLYSFANEIALQGQVAADVKTTMIVRNEQGYIDQLDLSEVIGQVENTQDSTLFEFSDVVMDAGVKYYYSLFNVDHAGNVSSPQFVSGLAQNGAQLDQLFATDGLWLKDLAAYSIIDSASDIYTNLISVLVDNKVSDQTNSNSPQEFIVERRSANGELDTSFANNGYKVIEDYVNYVPLKVYVDKDESYVLLKKIHYSDNDEVPKLAMIKLNSSGDLVQGFGENGLLVIDNVLGSEALNFIIGDDFLIHDNSVYLVGRAQDSQHFTNVFLLKFDKETGDRIDYDYQYVKEHRLNITNSDGTVVPSKMLVRFSYDTQDPLHIIVNAQQQILIASADYFSAHFWLIDSDGQLNSDRHSDNSPITIDGHSCYNQFYIEDLAVQTDGFLVATRCKTVMANSLNSVHRYDFDGYLDLDFANSGRLSIGDEKTAFSRLQLLVNDSDEFWLASTLNVMLTNNNQNENSKTIMQETVTSNGTNNEVTNQTIVNNLTQDALVSDTSNQSEATPVYGLYLGHWQKKGSLKPGYPIINNLLDTAAVFNQLSLLRLDYTGKRLLINGFSVDNTVNYLFMLRAL